MEKTEIVMKGAWEKMYNEALERARKLKEMYPQDAPGYEEVFPELRESEDERIRKHLIEIVETYWGKTNDPGKAADLAYLEKQKDASKAIEAVDRIDKYIDEHLANAHDMKDSNPEKKYYRGWDDALGKMAGILQDVYSGEKQKAENVSATTMIPSCWAEEPSLQKEQKPAEWSEEDEKMLTDISWAIRHCAYDDKKKERVIKWFNDDYRKSLRLVKQEWSKEDEKMMYLTKMQLRILQSHLSHAHSESMSDMEYSSQLLQIEKCVSWLDIRFKSLRPQYHGDITMTEAYKMGLEAGKASSWRPSEEQMNALNFAITYFMHETSYKNPTELRDLYEQLKKLI